MSRDRNILQVKEEDQKKKKKLNKVEISYLPDKEFKVMIIKTHYKIRRYAIKLDLCFYDKDQGGFISNSLMN